MSERHVVLVKPGDVLLIGNVEGYLRQTDADVDAIGEFFREVDIRCIMFPDDMDIGMINEDTLRSLLDG